MDYIANTLKGIFIVFYDESQNTLLGASLEPRLRNYIIYGGR